MATLRGFEFIFDDGGRCGRGKFTGDCGPRALAIAADMPYTKAVEKLRGMGTGRLLKGAKYDPTAATYNQDMDDALYLLGWKQVQTTDAPPAGCTAIVRQANHFVAIKDGLVRDEFDSRRKLVKQYWIKPSTKRARAATRRQQEPVAAPTRKRATKLTDDDVRTIRRLRNTDGWSCAAIARRFGCHATTVSEIARRITRTDVPD